MTPVAVPRALPPGASIAGPAHELDRLVEHTAPRRDIHLILT